MASSTLDCARQSRRAWARSTLMIALRAFEAASTSSNQDGRDVGAGEVPDVDVVADAGAVARRVVDAGDWHNLPVGGDLLDDPGAADPTAR